MKSALLRALLGAAAILLLAPLRTTTAQSVDLGGLAYVDYFLNLSSPDEEAEGLHGFTYRRLYLTTDFRLSEDFRGRARLEANDGSTGPNGPVAFVKDLWLEWAYAGPHTATLGVTPPPAFQVAEDFWNYRSLEKTILDLQGLVSSRDFGIRFDGPLLGDGSLRYAAMLANNRGTRPEADRYKRAYGQIGYFPSERVAFTVGLDRAGYPDPWESGTRLSAFGGYAGRALRGGLEIYRFALAAENASGRESTGASLFTSVPVASRWEVVGRVDFVHEESEFTEHNEMFLLGGVAYAPIEQVRLIPNIWYFDTDQTEEAETLARMTVELSF